MLRLIRSRKNRLLLSISEPCASNSLSNARAEQVVDMNEPHRPAILHDEQGCDGRRIDDLKSRARHDAARHGFWRWCHDFRRAPIQQAVPHMPPQIAIGNDAPQKTVLIYYAKAP